MNYDDLRRMNFHPSMLSIEDQGATGDDRITNTRHFSTVSVCLTHTDRISLDRLSGTNDFDNQVTSLTLDIALTDNTRIPQEILGRYRNPEMVIPVRLCPHSHHSASYAQAVRDYP